MNKVFKLLNDKNYVINKEIINAIKYDISYYDFLVLIYIINDTNRVFDASSISNEFNMSLDKVMESFNNLLSNNIIELVQDTDDSGRMIDKVSLNKLYQSIDISLDEEKKEIKKDTIFDKIEHEFGSTLSQMECEIINAWLDNYSEELILEALKEAVWNGVKNLRYIDKILYEWGKKGIKNKEDVEKNKKERKEDNGQQDLFEYDWLNDDE